MKTRAAIAVIVYLVAVAVPAFGLYDAFGPETKVDLGDAGQLIALVAACLFTFVLATLAGVLLKKSEEPQLMGLISAIFERHDHAADKS